VRFLTPTENKRLNELIGFLCVVAAVLIGLALISYSPRDAAFNVSATGGEGHLRPAVPDIWICGVSDSGGAGNSGLPVVPEPGD
jgi:hypothetical protein